MLAITIEELCVFAGSNGFSYAVPDTTDRRIKMTGWRVHGNLFPPGELERRQLIFRLFDLLIKDSPFLLWREHDLPVRPWDQLNSVRDTYRRGLQRILDALDYGRNVPALRFNWSDLDLAVIIVFLMTCISVPGYSDFCVMPEKGRFVLRFDHDDLYTIVCADEETMLSVTKKLDSLND